MKAIKLQCKRCGMNLLDNDCRVNFPQSDLAQYVRDYNILYHNDNVLLTIYKPETVPGEKSN